MPDPRALWLPPRRALALALAATTLCLHVAKEHPAIRRRLLAAIIQATARRGLTMTARDIHLSWSGEVTIEGMELNPVQGVHLRSRRTVLTPCWRSVLTAEPAITALELDEGWVELTTTRGRLPTYTLRLARLQARFDRALRGWDVTLEPVGGGSVRLHGRRDERAALHATLSDVSLTHLPLWAREHAGVEVSGTVGGTLELEMTSDLAVGRLLAALVSEDLALAGEAVGPIPIAPLALGGSLALVWDTERVVVDEVVLQFAHGAAQLRIEGEVSRGAADTLLLSAELESHEMAKLLASLPVSLGWPKAAPAVEGRFGASLRLEGPLSEPADWRVEGDLDLGDLRRRSRGTLPALALAFEHRAPDTLGGERRFVVGPSNPDFVPLAELPQHVVDAVTTSEDAGFFVHGGFDFDEIRQSLIAVAEAGRPVRGGSTITQQLAKNLFLTRAKTLARKVREALVTIALESSLSKSRILELYLNVIEWGPGVFGIGPAAALYFGKDARALTAKEAAYLASIIPNPVRYYAAYTRGGHSRWERRLETLLAKMNENGRLGSEAYLQALRSPLVFVRN